VRKRAAARPEGSAGADLDPVGHGLGGRGFAWGPVTASLAVGQHSIHLGRPARFEGAGHEPWLKDIDRAVR